MVVKCANGTCNICKSSAEELLKASPNLAVVVEAAAVKASSFPVEDVPESVETETHRLFREAREVYLKAIINRATSTLLATLREGGIKHSFTVKGETTAKFIKDHFETHGCRVYWNDTKVNNNFDIDLYFE